jgi:nucleosome binding factor SPN SPT16 subunit
LAAHQNGLRFTTNKGEIVDVMYSNIKHAFFEPCEKSTLVLVHFHLKDYILIGKKKQKDVQFFTEVIAASLNLDNNRRSAYDPDEFEEEQRERELRNRLNKNFLEFCKKVEKVAKHYEFDLTFDVPYSDMGFYGNCGRETVFIQPSLNCLINLTEQPFFVVHMSEVDHVHFERVTYATKTFDMVLILKNFDIMPRMITAIDLKYLEAIQEWLCDVRITYTAGPQAFAWKGVMESAKEDERFYLDTDENGDPKAWKDIGWNVLTAEVEDGSEEEDDGDSSFAGSGSSEEESEESEDSDGSDESFEEESEDDSYDEEAEDELEEQGEDWDELEKKAAVSDKQKRINERMGIEDDGDAPVKKKSRK